MLKVATSGHLFKLLLKVLLFRSDQDRVVLVYVAVKCDIKRMLVILCSLVVGRATWTEFRRNQEQAHFWTPNELPRIIETMKGLKPVW